MSRITAILLSALLLWVPLELRASSCGMPDSDAPGMECDGACCATMKSCAAQESPVRPMPIVPNAEARSSTPMAMPRVSYSSGWEFAFRVVRQPVVLHAWQRHSIPPLATSCIRLV